MDLRIWLHLGCESEERLHPQLVSFDIEVGFDLSPLGVFTDKIEDTVCYLELVQFIEDHCKSRSFKLVEYLTQAIYELVLKFISPHADLVSHIKVKTHKKSPPVRNVHGGVTFTYNTCLNRQKTQQAKRRRVKCIK